MIFLHEHCLPKAHQERPTEELEKAENLEKKRPFKEQNPQTSLWRALLEGWPSFPGRGKKKGK